MFTSRHTLSLHDALRIFQLHTHMFLGRPVMLFLGLMGFLFFIALVSGTVLYAPFMRKLDFGTLRVSRSERLRQIDYHNLLGIVALAWMSVDRKSTRLNSSH